MIFLLQAERIQLQYPEDADSATVAWLLTNAIADGYFANPAGEALTAAIFKEHYEHILTSISGEADFEFYKNGEQHLPAQPPQIEDVLFVTAYANEWNNRQYFIETTNAWLLFGWATMA